MDDLVVNFFEPRDQAQKSRLVKEAIVEHPPSALLIDRPIDEVHVSKRHPVVSDVQNNHIGASIVQMRVVVLIIELHIVVFDLERRPQSCYATVTTPEKGESLADMAFIEPDAVLEFDN